MIIPIKKIILEASKLDKVANSYIKKREPNKALNLYEKQNAGFNRNFKISLETKFNLSVNSCNFLNLGIATINNVPTTNKIANMATPIIHAIELSPFVNTFTNPPIPIIGAYTTTLNSIVINC